MTDETPEAARERRTQVRLGPFIITTVAAQEERDQEMYSQGFNEDEASVEYEHGRLKIIIEQQALLLNRLATETGEDGFNLVNWPGMTDDVRDALRHYL